MADAMRYFALLLLFVSFLPSQETKHALTTEQCRADQRLWQDKLQTPDRSTLPDYMTLDKWFSEMAECRTLDPENVRQYDHYVWETLRLTKRRVWSIFSTVMVCLINFSKKTRLERGSDKT